MRLSAFGKEGVVFHHSLSNVLSGYLKIFTLDDGGTRQVHNTCRSVTYEHGIILPCIIIDAVLLERSGKDLPGWILETDLKALEVI